MSITGWHWRYQEESVGVWWGLGGGGGVAGARGSRAGVSFTPSHSEYQLFHYVSSLLAALAVPHTKTPRPPSPCLLTNDGGLKMTACQLGSSMVQQSLESQAKQPLAYTLWPMWAVFNTLNQVKHPFLTLNDSSPTACRILWLNVCLFA